jgi:hypothetical protein
MIVAFKFNLGSNDAEPLGLDFKRCTKGSEQNVSDSVGKLLVSKGLASEIVQPVRGVPDAPAIAEASQPTIKAEPVVAKPKKTFHKES